eukprot:CAMPEP_0116083644 /NCGR_PEP_ID=MMETSP0327-20121206/3384_1 /TAXON_ID=44447 /ORGANISM="Pseudo-nitzschia delicatissima, Strain B596" /LENGTH=342 /DNA_ID=CAMNT_0003574547 /DNA_START=168 /DNA_END=1196 /DNA_ORIENTATION=+
MEAAKERPMDFHRHHAVILFALAVGMIGCLPSFAMGFFVEQRLTKKTVTTTFSSTSPKGETPEPRSLSLEMKPEEKLKRNKNKDTDGLATIPDIATALEKSPAIDSFSEFSKTKTPLLAELLKGEGEALPKQDSMQPWKGRSSEWALVGLATFALVGILGDLLTNYEWVQTLRYFWPLSLGVYYGMLWNLANEKDVALRRKTVEAFGLSAAFSPKDDQDDWKSMLYQMGYVLGGIGLFVGGLADAVLPVWMTGPNFITNAGLAPDCAVLLLVLGVIDEFNIFGNQEVDDETKLLASSSSSDETTTGTSLLLKITLWAELYKLGEGSLDEVFTNLQTLISSST